MSTSPISSELRRYVSERAEAICEYCLIAAVDSGTTCEVDHIVSLKHLGLTVADNLALACAQCNRNKGTDVGSIDQQSGEFVRFYHPRKDRWTDHFRLEGSRIIGVTNVGRVTVQMLKLNAAWRVQVRKMLIATGRYPNEAANRLMRAAKGSN